MKTTIKIVDGKNGWGLKINGMYVNCIDNDNIKLIVCDSIPCGMSEFVNIYALRAFWHRYMNYLIAIAPHKRYHYNSVWGSLIRVD